MLQRVEPLAEELGLMANSTGLALLWLAVIKRIAQVSTRQTQLDF